MPPRSLTACSFLPHEGAAAPAARQSRFRGPCLKGVWHARLLNASGSLRAVGAGLGWSGAELRC